MAFYVCSQCGEADPKHEGEAYGADDWRCVYCSGKRDRPPGWSPPAPPADPVPAQDDRLERLLERLEQRPAPAPRSEPVRTPPRVTVLDMHELLTTDPPPLDWRVDGIFAGSRLTLFGGREKRGKSLVQLGFAICMACGGGELAGIDVKAGRTLIFDAENGKDEVQRRLHAMGLPRRHERELIVAEVRGFDLRYDLDEVTRLVDQYDPDLVLLDSFRALWRGDERDEAQVAECLYPLADLAHDGRAAWGLTHHAQKSGEEYRGSTGIGAAVDWIVMIDRIRNDPERRHRRRISNEMARMARERDDRWLSIRSESDDGPLSFAEIEPYESRAEEGPTEAQRLADLAEAFIPQIELDGGWPPAKLRDAIGCPRGDTWTRLRAELRARGWTFSGTTSASLIHPPASGSGDAGSNGHLFGADRPQSAIDDDWQD